MSPEAGMSALPEAHDIADDEIAADLPAMPQIEEPDDAMMADLAAELAVGEQFGGSFGGPTQDAGPAMPVEAQETGLPQNGIGTGVGNGIGTALTPVLTPVLAMAATLPSILHLLTCRTQRFRIMTAPSGTCRSMTRWLTSMPVVPPPRSRWTSPVLMRRGRWIRWRCRANLTNCATVDCSAPNHL